MSHRCAIVGYGAMGRLYHQILSDPGEQIGLQIVAAADSSAHVVQSVNEQWLVFVDYRDLLNADVDAVLFATPPSTHFAMGRDALEAGKHVWIEKPPTRTSAQCHELTAVSRARRRVLFHAFHARYNEAVALARHRLEGRVVRVVRAAYREHVDRFYPSGSWVHREGVLWDSGINAFSVLTYVLPASAPLCVKASELQRTSGAKVETAARIAFTVGDTGRGVLELDWQYAGPEIRQIVIAADDIELTIDITTDALYENGRLITSTGTMRGGLRQEYARMLRHFSEALNSSVSVCSCIEVALVESALRLATSGP